MYDVLVVGYLPSGKVGAVETFTVEASIDANTYCYNYGVRAARKLQVKRPEFNWRYHECAPAGMMDDKVSKFLCEAIRNILDLPV